MPKVTLTVAEIRLPAEGKARGNIIGTDGRKYGCFREKFSLFQVGQSYEVEVTDGQYENVVSAKPVAAASPQSQPAASAAPSGANGHGNGNGYYRPTCPEDAERMFVCSILTALIKVGEIKNDKAQLFHSVNMLRLLWQHTFGNGSVAGGAFSASEAGQRPRLVAAE